jgi:hypothetical protein
MFPAPWNMLPVIADGFEFYYLAMDAMVTWTGEYILQLGKLERTAVTGSGDTFFDYINVISTALLAVCASLLFIFISKSDKHYSTLRAIVITYARYYLAIYMLSYGIAKLYELQFPFPSIVRLDQSIGDASPMGLLWSFMGYSGSYSFFGGLCEVLGGTLLFFRRTTVIGALVTLGVMVNVAMLNYAYDVPVKLFSTHLVFFCFVIISPNLLRLAQFFFGRKTVSLTEEGLTLEGWWISRMRVFMKAIIIISFPAFIIWDDRELLAQRTMRHPFNAVYTPIDFSIQSKTPYEILPDSIRWNKMIFNNGAATIEYRDSQKQTFTAVIDSVQRTIRLTSSMDSSQVNTFSYEFTSDSTFTLFGRMHDDTLKTLLHMKRPEDFRLVNRGFHWVSEYPFNK